MEFCIRKEENGLTVLSFLRQKLSVSQKTLRHWKYMENGICVNGAQVSVRYCLCTGDRLTVADRDKPADHASDIVPSGICPDILYEDDALIAVNKPPHMPTHPSHGHTEDTLANAMATLYRERGLPFVFRPAGRLDRNTSGIVVCSKTQAAASFLFDAQSSHRIRKCYLAILDGILDVSPVGTERTIICGIRRQTESIIMRTVCDADRDSPQYAETRYRVLAISHDPAMTLVVAMPLTGRTHQLRVHFSHIGFPILGDDLYGSPSTWIDRHALHAFLLSVPRPFDGEYLTLTAPLPTDFSALLPRFGLHTTQDMEVLIHEKQLFSGKEF